MSVDNAHTVDSVGIEKDSGEAILTISDHLPWDDKNEHLLLLQGKLNAYLAFVESGQIYSSYPNAKGRKCTISVVSLYEPTKNAALFLERAKIVVEAAGLGFRFEQRHFNTKRS